MAQGMYISTSVVCMAIITKKLSFLYIMAHCLSEVEDKTNSKPQYHHKIQEMSLTGQATEIMFSNAFVLALIYSA